jgi:glyoxylate/hydroxypyruvate reductase A
LRNHRSVLLYACPPVPPDLWVSAFRQDMPELDVRIWPEISRPEEIDYAFVWHPPAGLFPALTRLRVIFSLGAGVEGLLANPELPARIPLIRMVDSSLAAGMAEFVIMQVLRYHRHMPEIEANQRMRLWKPLRSPIAKDRTVGILGFGQLGAHCAECLVSLGFDIAVWSRHPKTVTGITSFAGRAALPAFLARSEILVCLLPLTPDTLGILDAQAFAAMPPASFIINVGRGKHVVEEDLLRALDTGQIAGATMDVFTIEPLPESHPFWTHERVTVVPHISALTQPSTAVPLIAEAIRLDLAGLPLPHVVDRARGY